MQTYLSLRCQLEAILTVFYLMKTNCYSECFCPPEIYCWVGWKDQDTWVFKRAIIVLICRKYMIFKSHNRGSTFMLCELHPYLVVFLVLFLNRLRSGLVKLRRQFIFLLKSENIPFPHFPPCSSPHFPNFQVIWTKYYIY